MRSTTLISLLFVVVVIVVVAALLKAKARPTGGRFKAKPFLTPNELEFLTRMEAAAPELRFHAQVAMGALLAPVTARRENAREHMSTRGRFSQKIVDYVAQSRSTGEVVAVIELDDRTHDPAKDRERDAMVSQGGYKIVRWHSKTKPDVAAIRQALLPPDPPAMAPSSSPTSPRA